VGGPQLIGIGAAREDDITGHPLYRTSATLADGREIIYFDETAGAPRVLHDSRDLPPVQHSSQTRYDALAGEWVAIAGHRQTRTYHPPADACPLCPSTQGHLTEIPSPAYDVVVFENRFPSFAGVGPGAELPGQHTADAPPADRTAAAPGFPVMSRQGLFQPQPGNGRCEVVCFTSDHRASMSSLPASRVRTVVDVWADRTSALAGHPGVQQVFCFENRGIEIGVTLEHPHGQIYGYPFITPVTSRMLSQVAQYRAVNGRNLFADIVIEEAAGPRVVASNEHWFAFVPFAARWPLEVHLYPRRQVPDLPALTDAERDAFVPVYLEVLRRMEGVFADTLPSITAWHQAPVFAGRDDFWLHLRLFSIRRAVGKLKYLAGSESAMGAFINDIAPEAAAQRLRAVVL
jgi:UDPglucose--hexose-1-phosphate uridylyltransferase